MEVVRSQRLSVVVTRALRMASRGSAALGITTHALNIHSEAYAFEGSAHFYMNARRPNDKKHPPEQGNAQLIRSGDMGPQL